MRKVALAATVAAILLTNCMKKDVRQNALSSPTEVPALSSSASQVNPDGSSDYLILCKAQAIPVGLLEKISAIGSVKKSIGELGIVVASSSNPNFESELEKLSGVQSVLPDLKLNWLKSTIQQDQVVDLANDGSPSEQLETSATLGLSGTNPFVPLQWSLLSVNAKGAYQAGYKGAGAVVAVLDGGFHLNHPDIKDNIISSISFVPGETAQMANLNGFSHGSHVAGIIAASDNNIGIAGIAPSAKLKLVKVLADGGSGAWSWIIEGIYYAADQGVDIINMSLGAAIPRNGKFIDDGGTPNDPSDDVVINEAREVQDLITAMNRAFQYARRKGCLTIVAAGNSSMYVTGQGQGTFYPANCVDVLAIAANAPTNWALNQNTSLFDPASYTNFGASLIDFGGPGGDGDGSNTPATIIGITRPAWVFDLVLSVGTSTSYTWTAGTSMACPAASGVAALIAGKYGGNITNTQLESKLQRSAVNLGAREYYGHGQVNAANAIQQ